VAPPQTGKNRRQTGLTITKQLFIQTCVNRVFTSTTVYGCLHAAAQSATSLTLSGAYAPCGRRCHSQPAPAPPPQQPSSSCRCCRRCCRHPVPCHHCLHRRCCQHAPCPYPASEQAWAEAAAAPAAAAPVAAMAMVVMAAPPPSAAAAAPETRPCLCAPGGARIASATPAAARAVIGGVRVAAAVWHTGEGRRRSSGSGRGNKSQWTMRKEDC
jgi:hypothetical protein